MYIGPRPTGGMTMPKHRIFTTTFASVYPLYVQKAERKNRTKEEIDQIICWLTGYSQAGLQRQIEQESDFETFFAQAPAIHPNCSLIGTVNFEVDADMRVAMLGYAIGRAWWGRGLAIEAAR